MTGGDAQEVILILYEKLTNNDVTPVTLVLMKYMKYLYQVPLGRLL